MSNRHQQLKEKVKSKVFISMRLVKLGIPTNYKGYFYLIAILDGLLCGEINGKAFYKRVYPMIAEMFETTACTIERDIRHLINNTDNSVFEALLFNSNNKTKPTCQKFIFLLRDHILSYCG